MYETFLFNASSPVQIWFFVKAVVKWNWAEISRKFVLSQGVARLI